MTFAEAKKKGIEYHHTAWSRGYVSRKTDIDKHIVHKAGGKCKGLYYILAPSWLSSRYCNKVYFSMKEEDQK